MTPEIALALALVGGALYLSRRPASPPPPSPTPGTGIGLTLTTGDLGGVLAAVAARMATADGVRESAAAAGAAAAMPTLSPEWRTYRGGAAIPQFMTTAVEPIFGDVSGLVTPFISRPGAAGGLGPSGGALEVAGGRVYALGYDRRQWGEAPIVTDGDGAPWLAVYASQAGNNLLVACLAAEHRATGRTAAVSATLYRVGWPRLRKDAGGAYYVEGIGIAEMRAGQFTAAMYQRGLDAETALAATVAAAGIRI